MQELATLPGSGPWLRTARVSYKDASYLNSSTIAEVLASIATSMPNLIAISFDAAKATLPETLGACDTLIRRPPSLGRALEELSVFDPAPNSCYNRAETTAAVAATKRAPKTRSPAKIPPTVAPAPVKPKPVLSPLPQTHRGLTRLRRLVIDWPQAQPHTPNRLQGILIHPGLLHSILILSITFMVPFDIMAPLAPGLPRRYPWRPTSDR